MPGVKPYYRLAVDGKLIGIPKKIPGGCSKIRDRFQAPFSKGIVSLFVYASLDGKTDAPKPYLLNLTEDQKKTPVRIPMINFALDEKLKKYGDSFNIYSYGYVKINNPKVFPEFPGN
jgi:hypothetical protein